MLQEGTKVKISENAFPESTDREDIEARGKYGVISNVTGDLISVEIHGVDYPCIAEEVEELPEGTLLFDDYVAVTVTDRYKAALLELLAAEVEMMHQGDDPESWYYGRVTVHNLAHNRNLEFEFGSEADMPDDGLGQFGIIIE